MKRADVVYNGLHGESRDSVSLLIARLVFGLQPTSKLLIFLHLGKSSDGALAVCLLFVDI